MEDETKCFESKSKTLKKTSGADMVMTENIQGKVTGEI